MHIFRRCLKQYQLDYSWTTSSQETAPQKLEKQSSEFNGLTDVGFLALCTAFRQRWRERYFHIISSMVSVYFCLTCHPIMSLRSSRHFQLRYYHHQRRARVVVGHSGHRPFGCFRYVSMLVCTIPQGPGDAACTKLRAEVVISCTSTAIERNVSWEISLTSQMAISQHVALDISSDKAYARVLHCFWGPRKLNRYERASLVMQIVSPQARGRAFYWRIHKGGHACCVFLFAVS